MIPLAIPLSIGYYSVSHTDGYPTAMMGKTRRRRTRAHDTRPHPFTDELRAQPLLRECSELELRTLARAGDVVRAPAGRTLQRLDDPPRWVYFILTGEVATMRTGCRTVHRRGAVIGLREALDGSVRPKARHIAAVNDSTVFIIERRHVNGALTASPGLALGLIRELAAASASRQS
jgi:CRP-like cAMP-binding protein